MAEPDEREVLPPDQPPPPWRGGAEITVRQLDEVRMRGSREDFKQLVSTLVEEGKITVIDHEEPVAP